MSADGGASVPIGERVRSIIDLPPPEQSFLAKGRSRRVQRMAGHFADLLLLLVTSRLRVGDVAFQGVCPGTGETIELQGQCLWSRVFYTLASYYDFAVTRLLTAESLAVDQPIPGVDRFAAGEICDRSPPSQLPPSEAAARLITCKYLAVLFACQTRALFAGRPQSEHLLSLCDHTLHDSLKVLEGLRRSVPAGCHQLLLERLVTTSADRLAMVYAQAYRTYNREHRPGPFSTLRLSELSLLARRDEAVVVKYGSKRVERVFEEQTALLLQSLGFYAIPARAGERASDVVCISGDPSCHLTVLLEAKASHRPYGLPVRDRRAVEEYVTEARRRLATLPPLGLVLIVGQEPARLLEPKLRDLESRVHVPVRFCRAQDLADVRESLAGTVRLTLLMDALLKGPHVPAKGLGKRVAAQHVQIEANHASLVRSCMAVCYPEGAARGAWPSMCVSPPLDTARGRKGPTAESNRRERHQRKGSG